MLKTFPKKLLAIFLISFFIFSIAHASDLTGTTFIIRDPIIGTGGNYGTSTNFKFYSAGNTLFSGVDSSTNFIGHYGFLYYPYVTVGTLTATPVSTHVDLSWIASTAGGGWSVSGYKTGIASISGGPYTYTGVGNVTSYSYTALAPGNYCFVVQTLDALGNVIGTSNESCATVSQVITFDLDTYATATTSTETGTPYNVALGTLTTAAASGSNESSINSIWFDLETNGAGGAIVSVKSSGGALKSTSVPSDTIPSATATMTTGTANYGICDKRNGATSGTFNKVSPFDGATCTTTPTGNTVGALTTSAQNIYDSGSAPVYGGRAEMMLNAENSSVTPAHNDYTDTLTFIATSTF